MREPRADSWPGDQPKPKPSMVCRCGKAQKVPALPGLDPLFCRACLDAHAPLFAPPGPAPGSLAG